ncbi:hypothetical protein PG997_008157 [Apiospora hydei]|uniref:Nucleoside-diphosphate-sugar epimerase n=1 Tax=Apiospora hydei TaxID=1337664 RepID=A0ABR1WA08_9PEZI
MHLILTGATGLIGSSALDAMLRMNSVTKISILSRRPVQMVEDRPDPRVNVIIRKEFETYDEEVLAQLKGAAGCVWALGVAQSQVSRKSAGSPTTPPLPPHLILVPYAAGSLPLAWQEKHEEPKTDWPKFRDYVQITKTFAEAAAKAFSKLPGTEPSAAAASGKVPPASPPFRFVYVAGGDTTTKPGLLTAFQARIKGETELSLGAICRPSHLKGYSVRVFYPDMAGHDAIKPYIAPRPLVHSVAEAVLGAPIRHFAKNLWAPTDKLGEFLNELAMGHHDDINAEDVQGSVDGLTIISNADIRRVMGY